MLIIKQRETHVVGYVGKTKVVIKRGLKWSRVVAEEVYGKGGDQ